MLRWYDYVVRMNEARIGKRDGRVNYWVINCVEDRNLSKLIAKRVRGAIEG